MADDLDAEVNFDELENCMLASAKPIPDDAARSQPQTDQTTHETHVNDNEHGYNIAQEHDDDDGNNDNNNNNSTSSRNHKDRHHHRRHKKHRHASSHHKRARVSDGGEDDQLAGSDTAEENADELRRARREEKRRRREEKRQNRNRLRLHGSEGDEHSSDENEREGEADAEDSGKTRRSHSRRARRQRGKRDGKKRSLRYVLDAAESVSDDDFIDDDDDGEEAEAGFDAAAAVAAEQQQRNAPRFLFHEGDNEMTAEELGREYEERVKSMRRQQNSRAHPRQNNPQPNRLSLHSSAPRSLPLSAAPRTDPSSRSPHTNNSGVHNNNTNNNNNNNMLMNPTQQRISSTRFAAHRLPSGTDPNVFAIKCRPRMARLLVARIVNKCYAYRVGRNFEHRRVDLGIISAFCLDHVSEYIYVEAYRKLFVEHALNGLEGLFRFQITVVEPSELMQMMERRVRADRLHVGALVRLRRRRYRGDLAEVVAVDRDGHHLTCRAVPREDFVNKAYEKVGVVDARDRPVSAPRLFVPHLARGVVQDKEGGGVRWGELRFDRAGYILFDVSVRSVSAAVDSAAATTDELARFYNNDRARVREAIARTAGHVGGASSGPAGSNNTTSGVNGSVHVGANMCIGDRVRVVSGQLRDTVGTIVNIFTGNQTALLSCIVPHTGAANGSSSSSKSSFSEIQVRVELSACARSFVEGTHVVVDQGEHAGESGTVMQSILDTVLLFPDRRGVAGVTELRVRANDCHQSALLGNSFGHSHGVWHLFDLVAISEANVVACIVRLARHDVDVLTERNERRTLTYAQIKAIHPSHARAGGGGASATHRTVDRWQNVLQRGCEVHIQRTPLTPFHLGGGTGRVEQVHNATLFVHSRAMRENGGLVALPSSCVRLTGGQTSVRPAPPPPRQLPAPMRRAHNATRADLPATQGEARSSSGYEDWQAQSEWYEPSLPSTM